MFQTLAARLAQGGHRATLVLNEGAGRFVSPAVARECVARRGSCSVELVIRRAANPGGPFGILRTVSDSASLTDDFCHGGPALLSRLGVDAIVGDQMEPAAGLLARYLRLPQVSIACALPLERDARIPPPYLDWPYAEDEKALTRNRGGERVARLLLTAQRRMIARWSRRFALPEPCGTIEDCLAPAGTVAQITASLDFPRLAAARPLVCVGPIRPEAEMQPLPYPIDPDRPFVFMSLGTLQGHRFQLFKRVAKACRRLEAQLLVAHCGGLNRHQAERLGATWVTDFAPQRAVLARADLCVTHGGQNTVLDALDFGTPLMVLPIAFDQPGIAARVEHHAVGLKLSPRFLTIGKAEGALRTLLSDPGFRTRAATIGASIRQAGGAERAVVEVERLLGLSPA